MVPTHGCYVLLIGADVGGRLIEREQLNLVGCVLFAEGL